MDQDIYKFLSDASMPPALTPRDIAIQTAIDSYLPLYIELEQMAGGLQDLIAQASRGDLLRLCLNFLNRTSIPGGCLPLKGSHEEEEIDTARSRVLLWAAGQTSSGGEKNFRRRMNINDPKKSEIKIPSRQLTSLFVSGCWASSRHLPVNWGSVSASARRTIEGAYRYYSGKLFEDAVREAVRIATDHLPEDFQISQREVAISEGKNKESRIDIIAQAAGTRFYFPCKSSEIAGTSHSTVFVRDVNDSISKAGLPAERTLVVLGGLGWEGAAADLRAPYLIDPNHLPGDDEWKKDLSQRILDSRIFDDPTLLQSA